MTRLNKSRAVTLLCAIAFVVLCITATACGKKAGSSCTAGESTCLDKQTALTCQGGKFVEVACAGGAGCSKYQEHANCDDSIATLGATCMGEGDEEHACTPDKKIALVCRGGRFALFQNCRGQNGCAMLGRTVSCDTSVAAKGDPCKAQGGIACSEDKKEMLICRDGVFANYRYCRGRLGCQTGDAPTCDVSISKDGDPCGLPGQVVCSDDGQWELVCQNAIFTRSRACKKSGCVVTNRPGRSLDCN